jgi:hypothetical protein
MLVGREREVEKILQNLRRGIGTLVFGAAGAGKTAILLEVASRLGPARARGRHGAVYIGDCSRRRRLLEGALEGLVQDAGASVPSRESRPPARRRPLRYQELRELVCAKSRGRAICLFLDRLPELNRPMKHLLELLEQHFTLTCAVTAMPGAYDLYFWKYDRVEVGDLRRNDALPWIERELAGMGYESLLGKAIALEVYRLAWGNPRAISDTLHAIGSQVVPLDDPIRVRRMLISGMLLAWPSEGKCKR